MLRRCGLVCGHNDMKIIPGHQYSFFLGKLVDVKISVFITLADAILEQMWQFVEFTKLPFGKGRIHSRAHLPRIFVILFEISKKEVQQQIAKDEWSEYQVEQAHKDESSLEPCH